ncbi:MAG: DUF4878 domain-containing protein [Deltaproteobacteria bacterium]|nr:MAG: DUF4878 domain-containing protein [Deltaproteobacteria bacterium]
MRLLLVLLLVAACTPQRPPPPGAAGPVEAAKEFAAAVQRGDAATASQLLSAQTLREADAAAARARAFAGDAGTGPASGRQMLFNSALPQGKVSVRKIRQRSDGDATVEVKDEAGTATQFRMLLEGGSWKVDLSTGRELR